jgi:hypothetical protein
MKRKLLGLLAGGVRVALGGAVLLLLAGPLNVHVGTLFTQLAMMTFRVGFLGVLILVSSMSWTSTRVERPGLASLGVWLLAIGGGATAILTLIDVTIQVPRVMLVVDSFLGGAVFFVLFQVSRRFHVKDDDHVHAPLVTVQEVHDAHDGHVPEKG